MMPGGSLGVSPRSWSRDGSVVKQKLAPGTVRRVGAFAKPFRGQIAAYLVLVVIGAVLMVVPPLLAQRIVDDGVLGHDAGLVTTLALVVAGIAVAAAAAGLVERWYSARI